MIKEGFFNQSVKIKINHWIGYHIKHVLWISSSGNSDMGYAGGFAWQLKKDPLQHPTLVYDLRGCACPSCALKLYLLGFDLIKVTCS